MISHQLPFVNKLEIIRELWNIEVPDTQSDELQNSCYFEYFQEQYRLARQNDEPEAQLYTLRNICDIAHHLEAGESRAEIQSLLAMKLGINGSNHTLVISRVIDLTIRLWLMVHIGNVRRGVTAQTIISWDDGSLKNAVSSHFLSPPILTDPVKFERAFNAKNLERIAGIIIQWTPNLVDHLRLKEDGKKPVLNIFHHASFLNYHQD